MTALDGIARALREHGHDPRPGSGGNLVVRCPAHDDHDPSLSLRQIEGQALLLCFGGCDYRDVLAAVGLGPEALFDDPKKGFGARYQYTDVDGRVTRTVLRPVDKKAGKFSQSGETKLKQLFRLPQVVEAVAAGSTVYLVEGEKDCLALESVGQVATTAPEGASNFGKADIGPLKGAHVVAVVDRDGPGQKWAETVRGRLAGYAEDLSFVQAKVGKDAADHICAGYGVAAFELLTVNGPEWEDPLPIGWQTDLPPFPAHVLPSVLRDYVLGLSAEIQAPLDMAGSAVLGVGHGAIGGKVRIELRAGWTEPSNQYVVIVAPPASRKSKVIAECREPLDLAETELKRAFADEIEDKRIEREIREQYAETLKAKAAKSGADADIEAVQAAAAKAREVVVPIAPRLVMGDSSPEKMIGLLGQHDRMAAISAEAGVIDSLLGRHSKKPNLDPILKAHAGDRLDNETVARGAERADRPALTMVISVQPYALHELAKPGGEAAGRGLIARPMWSLTPDIIGTRRWGGSTAMNDAVRAAYRTRLSDLAVATTLLAEPVTLEITDGAAELIGEYHDRIEAMMAPGGEHGAGLIREWLGKSVGAVGRTAAVLHALHAPPPAPERRQDGRYDTEARPPWEPSPVAEDTMRAAITIGEYFRAHAAAALGGGEDRRAPLARQLLTWLLAHARFTFAVRDVQRSGPRPLRKLPPLSDAIDYLQSLGWVRPAEGKGYELRPDAATLATAATAATDPATAGESAGQDAKPGGLSLSPRVATGGDSSPETRRLSPVVATGGDNQEGGLTSRNWQPVAAVAAVAMNIATERVPGRTTTPTRSRSAVIGCVGCGAAAIGKDGAGNPRCERCMPLDDDVEEWSA